MTERTDFYGWKLLGVFWLILFANFSFPLYGAAVVNDFMAADLHLDRAGLGLAYGVLQLMVGLPAPLAAFCIHRRGVRFTMTAGCLAVIAGALLMAMWVRTGLQADLVLGGIIGVGVLAGGILAAQAGITRWFIKSKARAITLAHTGIGIGGFVAAPVLLRLISASRGNWRAGWWLMAGMSSVAALLAAFFVKEQPSDLGQLPDGEPAGPPKDSAPRAGASLAGSRGVYKTTEEWPLREVWRTPAIWLLLISILGFSAGYPLFLAHGLAHLRDLGFTPAAAAFSISVMLLSALAGQLLFAGVGDHLEPRLLWAAASAIFGVGMLLALHARGVAGLWLYAICLGSGFGIAFSAMMTLPANYFGSRAYAPVIGVVIAVGTAAGAAGAYAAGTVFDRYGTYLPAFYSIAGLSFLSALLLLLTKPPVRKEQPAPTAAQTG